jgi:hypothetical protein
VTEIGRLTGLGHVTCMEEMRNATKNAVQKAFRGRMILKWM